MDTRLWGIFQLRKHRLGRSIWNKAILQTSVMMVGVNVRLHTCMVAFQTNEMFENTYRLQRFLKSHIRPTWNQSQKQKTNGVTCDAKQKVWSWSYLNQVMVFNSSFDCWVLSLWWRSFLTLACASLCWLKIDLVFLFISHKLLFAQICIPINALGWRNSAIVQHIRPEKSFVYWLC